MRLYIISFLVFIGLFSCKTPNIVVSNSLKTDTSIYEVHGRQGWQFNQVIKYGNFKTSKVQRGCMDAK